MSLEKIIIFFLVLINAEIYNLQITQTIAIFGQF